MRALFIIPFFCFILATGGAAQDRISDSLVTLLQKHPQQDTVRLHLLNEYIFHRLLHYGGLETVLAEEAWTIAKKSKHMAGEVRATGNKAIIAARQGRPAEALSFASQALKRAEGASEKNALAYGYYYLGRVHAWNNDLKKALFYFQQAWRPAREAGNFFLESFVLGWLGSLFSDMGDYPQALDRFLESIAVAEKAGKPYWGINSRLSVGEFYSLYGDFSQALQYQLATLPAAEWLGSNHALAIIWDAIGQIYRSKGDFPLAIKAFEKSLSINNTARGGPWNKDAVLIHLADVYDRQGKYSEAKEYAKQSLNLLFSRPRRSFVRESEARRVLASIYLHTNKLDSARWQADSSLRMAQRLDHKKNIRDAGKILTEVYARKKDYAQAYHYQNLFVSYQDTLSGQENARQLASLQYAQELNKKEANIALLKKDQQIRREEARRQQLLLWGTLAGLSIVGLLALALLRSNHAKQKANTLLQEQKQKVEDTLTELKATQAQLIQKEKMASLGELTAGIAHEIQNPLNFVNNFAEVSKELVEEIKAEAGKGNSAEVTTIADDVLANLDKVVHHGRRADAIVKGMLQHSRAASAENELTDINVLVDEYLRLAYHGYRAKDKSFYADFTTSYDPSVRKVSVVPQDIGRVLLNLFNNAFYAVAKKKAQRETAYEPTVIVRTQKKNETVEICIRDNGTGISEQKMDKIFQPFFTTKPTGEGTGLGLSLSYDIITKGHSGRLKVISKEGEGTEFIIALPLSYSSKENEL